MNRILTFLLFVSFTGSNNAQSVTSFSEEQLIGLWSLKAYTSGKEEYQKRKTFRKNVSVLS